MRLYPRSRLDTYAIGLATSHANDHVKTLRLRLEEYEADGARERRLKEQWCRCCFYLLGGGLAGQAFTPWNCRACGQVAQHHNTATPMVCSSCATKLQLCRRCGGDIEQRERRRKFDFAAIPWTDPPKEEP